MSGSYSVFSGSFSDEIGQRFLKIMSHAGDAAFQDLYDHSMPQHPKRYRECLERVCGWEPSVVSDEVDRILREYPDTEQCFKHVYVGYVKAMRGGKTVRLMVSLPKMQDFMHTFYANLSKHRCVRDARYFQNASLLEQRITCMDALRDSLFQYLGEEHVKLDGTSMVSEPISRAVQNAPKSSGSDVSIQSQSSVRRSHTAESPAETSYRGETDQGEANPASRPERQPRSSDSQVSTRSSTVASDVPSSRRPGKPPSDAGSNASSRHSSSANYTQNDGSSKVISNVFEPDMPTVTEEENNFVDDDTAIGPDDSVSNIDFATKQHRQIQNFLNRRQPIDTVDEHSDRSSRTSMSLSSVSISQHGIVPKTSHTEEDAALFSSAPQSVRDTFQEMIGPNEEERASEVSMREATSRNRRRKSPIRSYVTHMTDDDD